MTTTLINEQLLQPKYFPNRNDFIRKKYSLSAKYQIFDFDNKHSLCAFWVNWVACTAVYLHASSYGWRIVLCGNCWFDFWNLCQTLDPLRAPLRDHTYTHRKREKSSTVPFASAIEWKSNTVLIILYLFPTRCLLYYLEPVRALHLELLHLFVLLQIYFFFVFEFSNHFYLNSYISLEFLLQFAPHAFDKETKKKKIKK